MKVCSKCGAEKELSEFGVRKNRKSGYNSACKECLNIQKQKAKTENPTRFREYNKKSYEKCKDRHIESKKAYTSRPDVKIKRRENVRRHRLRHPEKITERQKKYKHLRSAWKKKNRGVVRFYTAKRRSMELKATPKWLTSKQLQEIEKIYLTANHMSTFHEEKFHVDHIEPLQGKISCGLMVPWNLRIIPAIENLKKGNKLIEV